MARDGSGNYTLPAGNPVVDGTPIDVLWANPTMADIAVQLNNVYTRDGVLGPLAAFKFVDGTDAAPGATFSNQTGTGLWNAASSSGYSFRGTVHFTSSASLLTVNVPLSAPSGVAGNLTGNVTGNLTGNVTGNVTGRLLGSESSGSYTPTYSSAVECTLGTAQACYWTRVGDVVTVRGAVTLSTSSASPTTQRSILLTLPVTIEPAAVISGVGSFNTSSAIYPALVTYSGSLAQLVFFGPSSEPTTGLAFEFSYLAD